MIMLGNKYAYANVCTLAKQTIELDFDKVYKLSMPYEFACKFFDQPWVGNILELFVIKILNFNSTTKLGSRIFHNV